MTTVEKTIVNQRNEYLRDIANLNTGAATVDGDSAVQTSQPVVQHATA